VCLRRAATARRLPPVDNDRALRRATTLVHDDGQTQPSREGKIGRMLGAQYTADAIGLQDELDVRGDGFGW
jgi:hypothetical protein